MNARQLEKLGVPTHALKATQQLISKLAQARIIDARDFKDHLKQVLKDPAAFVDHEHLGELAQTVLKADEESTYVPREERAPVAVYGDVNLDKGSRDQIRNASELPITSACALMPDAHVGYGLPIGGVMATRNAVVPYAVGVDIACRMRLSVYDVPAEKLESMRDNLRKVLEAETRFGIGAKFKSPQEHDVLDADWDITGVTRHNFPKARAQLGTSGSGNHFVEWGILTLDQDDLGLPAGQYLSLLSHSGSRGTGAAVCAHYSKLAMQAHPDLPRHLKYLAWLDMDTAEGQEYWAAMNLMGDYAAANHEVIHRNVAKAAGLTIASTVENHHNFAWLEEHDGEDVYVHRKGATPAGEGVLGVIPGSMATPGYVVRGRGEAASLRSASHGAGRVMSRTAAKDQFNWKAVQPTLEQAGVEVLSAGIDEVPGVYKDINEVMAAQTELVDIVARFNPKIVKMAPAGERPED